MNGMRLQRLVAAMTITLAAATLGWPSPAAAGGGGAGAVGSGDEILSSIMAWANSTRSGSTPTKAPPCHWRRLTDRQVIFLIHVLASMPELHESGFQRALEEYLGSEVLVTDELPAEPERPAGEEAAGAENPVHTVTRVSVANFALRVQICNGVAQTMQVVAQSIDGDDEAAVAVAATGQARQLRTLPPPEPVFSPGAMPTAAGPALRALLGEPVFIGVAPPAAHTSTLAFGGRTVRAHARPSALEVFDGQWAEDVGRTVSCPFNGGFDATAGAPPVQVQAATGCTITYDRATGGDRRGAWAGYVLLEWDGHYTVDDDPTPLPLGDLFSFAPFAIAVQEAEAVIER